MSPDMEKKKQPLPSWLRLLLTDPFYLLHFLAFLSYLTLRTSSRLQILLPHLSHYSLLRKEIQSILAISCFALIKLIKSETWESFIADTLFVAKVFIIFIAFFVDYHLALAYCVGFFGIFILAQQPSCCELGDSSQLTPLQLETLLTEGNTSRFWLVEFRSSLSPACVQLSRVFTDLSITYSNKHLSFGIVDLGHFPIAAEKCGISTNGRLAKLPTYILFENSVEVSRYPPYDNRTKDSGSITKRVLCQHFELDRLLLEYIFDK